MNRAVSRVPNTLPKRIGVGSVSKCICRSSNSVGISGRNVPVGAKGPSNGLSSTSGIVCKSTSPKCLFKFGGALH